jgi:8-oxo-dGTP diphosphatase
MSETLKACPQEWVAGFCFSDNEHVFLIKKAKPEWQKGKLNGVGGKVEAGESPIEAMHREWAEETGASKQDWWPFCTLDWKGGRVYFYACSSNQEGPLGGGRFAKFNREGEEPVECYEIKDWLFKHTIPNLRWLIPLALDKDRVLSSVAEHDAWNADTLPAEASAHKLRVEGALAMLNSCYGPRDWSNDGMPGATMEQVIQAAADSIITAYEKREGK